MSRHAGDGVKRQPANRAGIERYDIGDVLAGVNGIQADDFTRQMEAKDLFLAFVVDDITLETAGANGGNGTEFVSGPEQVFSWLYRTGAMDDLLETLGFVRRQTSRQA